MRFLDGRSCMQNSTAEEASQNPYSNCPILHDCCDVCFAVAMRFLDGRSCMQNFTAAEVSQNPYSNCSILHDCYDVCFAVARRFLDGRLPLLRWFDLVLFWDSTLTAKIC